MQEILIKKLYEYIRENNPDLLLQLEEDGKVTEYLSGKISLVENLLNQPEEGPEYIKEGTCMDILTKDLRPSKYNYICNILEEDFEKVYHQLQESGTLKFEVINLINRCLQLFAEFDFSEENEENRFLRYAITGAVNEYLESNQ